MALANGPERFGAVTRALHWLVAALVLGQLALGLRIATMQASFDTLWLFSLHKSLGILVLALIVLRWLWHRISPPPPPMGGGPPWQPRLARLVHRAFYVVLILMPLAGWVASSATGLDVVLVGGIVLPPLAPAIPWIETVFFAMHAALAALLALLIALHLGGVALHLRRRDGTLARMALGRPAR